MAILTNGLGDTPHLRSIGESVGRQQPTSIHEGLFVGLPVFLAKVGVGPVSVKVALEKLERRLVISVKRLTGSRRCEEDAGGELGLAVGGLHDLFSEWLVGLHCLD
jgi:hypothetical protein